MKLLLALALAGYATSTSPDEITPAMRAEWQLAQVALSSHLWGRADALNVHPDTFRWTAINGPFSCAKVQANGCYGNDHVQWNTRTPTVIRHEGGHAILERLGDRRWRCYEHDPKPEDRPDGYVLCVQRRR